MNYSESQDILDKVKSSKSILVFCHRNADADSVGSSLSLMSALRTFVSDVSVISPNRLNENFKFLPGFNEIKVMDLEKYDFSKHDLVVLPDIADWGRVFSSNENKAKGVFSIVIDNHETNEKFGDLNLIDLKTSSTAEMVYKLFEDWEIKISKDLATCLMAGIVGDTGSFQYEVYERTFEIADRLVHLGIEVREITYNLFDSYDLKIIEFWGEVIKSLKVEDNFVIAAIPFEKFSKYSHLIGSRQSSSDMIIKKIKGTDFGIVMTEDQENNFTLSFRARTKADVSILAKKLGGGGHPGAAGGKITGMNFDEAYKKVFSEAKAFAQTLK